ncbi:hypothetical protein BKA56DRAFT_611089 [Ilyonectria sp. MPI-CAGE-AT-0026]|nr:hypothetical protein BKA56DRAFT_611089 [Ilyonectria sp. MPI-CAGE-AT-0026]
MEPGLRPFNPLFSPISVWWPAWRIDFQARPAAVDAVAPALCDHMRDPCVRRLTARPRLSSSTGQLAGKDQKDRRGPWMLKGQDCTCTCCSNVFHTGWSYGALLQVSMSLQDASNDRSRVSELSHVRGLVLAGFTQLPPDGSVAASIPAILHDTSAPFRLKESWFQTQSRRSNSKPVPTVSARAGDIVLPNEGKRRLQCYPPLALLHSLARESLCVMSSVMETLPCGTDHVSVVLVGSELGFGGALDGRGSGRGEVDTSSTPRTTCTVPHRTSPAGGSHLNQ